MEISNYANLTRVQGISKIECKIVDFINTVYVQEIPSKQLFFSKNHNFTPNFKDTSYDRSHAYDCTHTHAHAHMYNVLKLHNHIYYENNVKTLDQLKYMQLDFLY